ncbi:pyruvate dehydrogenase (acetyl-transferring) E1 component subunit alpha [bacterium]|nr:pyruvate dehydrogenase (acetyl-transferring) E1 component subunit alpha [candidate division CSSED10-310 bacterium]
MGYKKIFRGETLRLEILDKDGRIDRKNMPEIDRDHMIRMFTLMKQMRAFDEKALNLQRQGRIGTYGSLRGQEAAQAGLAINLSETDDWLVQSFREHGVLMSLGIPMHIIYSYWKGDERGNLGEHGIKCLPPSVPVGSQLLHAVGIGMAMAKRGLPGVAVGFAGDGATSEGDFHEAMNFAGVFKARTLIYIQNNGWAISVPFKKQTAAESLAQRGLAYNVPSIQVDGNDVLAVYEASRKALDHIRSGNGPYLIEAVTFRMGDHTTADDQSRYRTPELVAYWEERDPIQRMRTFLVNEKIISQADEDAISHSVSEAVDGAVRELESMPPPDPMTIFETMYAEKPWHLKEQQTMLKTELESMHGKEVVR